MFKIGNSKELPPIPDYLSDMCKDFVMQCLQRNPQHRPTAAQLLEHPFVKSTSPLARHIPSHEPLESPSGMPNGIRLMVSLSLSWPCYVFILLEVYLYCYDLEG